MSRGAWVALAVLLAVWLEADGSHDLALLFGIAALVMTRGFATPRPPNPPPRKENR